MNYLNEQLQRSPDMFDKIFNDFTKGFYQVIIIYDFIYCMGYLLSFDFFSGSTFEGMDSNGLFVQTLCL